MELLFREVVPANMNGTLLTHLLANKEAETRVSIRFPTQTGEKTSHEVITQRLPKAAAVALGNGPDIPWTPVLLDASSHKGQVVT